MTMKYRDEPWNIGIIWDCTDTGDYLLAINGGFRSHGGTPIISWMVFVNGKNLNIPRFIFIF